MSGHDRLWPTLRSPLLLIGRSRRVITVMELHNKHPSSVSSTSDRQSISPELSIVTRVRVPVVQS